MDELGIITKHLIEQGKLTVAHTVSGFNGWLEGSVNGQDKALWIKGIIRGYQHNRAIFQLETENGSIQCFIEKPIRAQYASLLALGEIVKVRAVLEVYAEKAYLQLNIQEVALIQSLISTPLKTPEDICLSVNTWVNKAPLLTVQGTVQKYRALTGSFVYFDLTEGPSAIRCIMHSNAKLLGDLILGDGVDIELIAGLAFYERKSRFQLDIQQVRAVTKVQQSSSFQATNRDAVKFQPIMRQLQAKGLWPKRASHMIPKVVKQIGLITSQNSKALGDFQTNYQRNSGKATIQTEFAAVKGKSAAMEVASAINRFNQSKFVDIIVVTRGGGDKLELAEVFDDYQVAEAICHSTIPVVTAIGHTTDHTFADEIADIKYTTPTEAAIDLAKIPAKKRWFG